MKKRFLAILLMGIMMVPQVVHSEELTSDIPMLSEESIIDLEQEILSDEIPQSEEDSSLVFDFEDDLTSEAVPSMVSASNSAVEKAYQKYIEILNRPYDENELRYDKFALVYLNDNDIPDLIAHDPHEKDDINLHSIEISLDGEKRRGNQTAGDYVYKYYLERGSYIIVEYDDPKGIERYYFRLTESPKDDTFYLKSSYNNRSYVYYICTYAPNHSATKITEEEFLSYINKGTQKEIPFVNNTPENRTRYIPYSAPSVELSKTSIIGVYNSAKGGDIRWNAVTGATGYEVYRKRSGEGTKKVATTTNVNVTQCYDPGIKDNCWERVYNYYVIPVAGSIKGPKSDDATLQRLAPMTLTSVKNTAAGKAAVTWKCSVNTNKANGYELQYAETKRNLSYRADTFKAVTINGRNNLNKTISGLKKGKTYYFRIRCYVNYTNSVTGKTTKTWSQYSNVLSVKITR